MSVFKLIGGSLSAKNTLDYCDKKAVLKEGVFCFADTVENDFDQIRSAYGKEDGRQALHFTLAFDPKELNPTRLSDQHKALAIGVEMAQTISSENQAVCYVHNDQEHLHVHIVMNAVSMEHGSKFQMDVSKYRYQYETDKKYKHPNLFQLREKADEIVQKYGIEPLEKENMTKKTPYTRLNPQNSWKGRMAQEVNQALETTATLDDFIEKLEEQHIGVVIRGNTTTFEELTLKQMNRKKYKVRSTTLVEGLTTDKITNLLKNNFEAEFERKRTRKVNTQKKELKPADRENVPKKTAYTPGMTLQRVLEDDVEKWRAEKDYERLRLKIAREQSQRE